MNCLSIIVSCCTLHYTRCSWLLLWPPSHTSHSTTASSATWLFAPQYHAVSSCPITGHALGPASLVSADTTLVLGGAQKLRLPNASAAAKYRTSGGSDLQMSTQPTVLNVEKAVLVGASSNSKSTGYVWMLACGMASTAESWPHIDAAATICHSHHCALMFT